MSMSKGPPATLVKVKCLDYIIYFIWDEKKEQFESLSESHLSRASPGYTRLNEAARKKEYDSFIQNSNVITTVKIPLWQPNTLGKPWEKKSLEVQQGATRSLLDIGRLFESSKPGYQLLADLLCGMHCRSLRCAEPSFHPVTSINSTSPEVLDALKAIIKASVRVSKWQPRSRLTIRLKAILDYRVGPGEWPRHIQDFAQTVCHVKGYKKLKFPPTYTDTPVLVVGAAKAQIQEASPYWENAAVILVNSDAADCKPTKITSADIASYDPEVVRHLKEQRKHIAALLRWWWSVFEDEDAWARGIVKEARASFGKPDSRYIRVELDPSKLRDAIRYRVLLNFLNEVESSGVLAANELAPYRQATKDVFDPAPPEAVVRRHVEDPAVFLEIMRNLTAEKADSIILEEARFVKKDKPWAAWRTINGEKYLVLAEGTWKAAYAKAARKRTDLETSFFQKDDWEKELQKILATEGVIKEASSGYRYRYDLYGDGTRDKTYVIAIPAQLLES